MAGALVLAACASEGADCRSAGPAEVCLSRGSPIVVTATGLEPGSPVSERIEGPNAEPEGPGLPPATAGPDGEYRDTNRGLVIPAGSGPVTVFITVTPRGGSPTTVRFQRE